MNAEPRNAPPRAGRDVTAEQETEITLGVLDAVHENEKVTQRSLANELGIALGLANAYLKRCVRKGLIKVKQAPANRYLYYLTPKGFTEKSRLTAEYLSFSLTYFRRAREQCSALLERCAATGWKRVALVGGGDVAEIAALCNAEFRLDIVVVDPTGRHGDSLAGLPVVASLDDAGGVDAVIVTDMAAPQATVDDLAGRLPADRILAPPLLRVRLPGDAKPAGDKPAASKPAGDKAQGGRRKKMEPAS